MADEDIIDLGIDTRTAQRQIAELQEALASLGKADRPLKSLNATFTTLLKTLDGATTSSDHITVLAEAVDDFGNSVRTKVSGPVGTLSDRIDVVSTSMKRATDSSVQLKKGLEETLRASIQLAKQGTKKEVAETVPAREAFLPRRTRADLSTSGVDKFNQSYRQLLETQSRVNLSTEALDEVTKQFFANKPNTFLFGQAQVFEAMVKTRNVVRDLKKDIADPGRVDKLTDRFAKIIEPQLPKVDPKFAPTPRERDAAKKAFVDLQTFAVEHKEIIQREYKLLFNNIKAGAVSGLGPVQNEFVKLFHVAEEAYNNIGAKARKTAGIQADANKALLNVSGIRQANELATQGFEKQADAIRKQAADLIRSIPKATADLPAADTFNPKLLQARENALKSFQAALNSTKNQASDVQIALNRINEGTGPIGLEKGALRLYSALKQVLDIDKQINAQSFDHIRKELEEAGEAAKALAAAELTLQKTRQARTFAKTKLETGKTLTPQAIELAPNQSEKLRQQILKLDTTIIETKADIDTVKIAMQSLNEVNLKSFLEGKPEGVLAVRNAIVAVKQAQEDVNRAIERSVVATEKTIAAEDRAKAKALEHAAAVTAAGDKAKQLAVVQQLAVQDLTLPSKIDAQKLLDPAELEQSQIRITTALNKVQKEILESVNDFDDYHRATIAATDPAAFAVLEPRLQKLANLIRAATTEQLNFGAAVDSVSTRQARQADIASARTKALSLPTPTEHLPTAGVDPKAFDTLRNKANAYQLAVERAKLSTAELDRVIESLSSGKIEFDDSRLLSVHNTARGVITAEDSIIAKNAQLRASAQEATAVIVGGYKRQEEEIAQLITKQFQLDLVVGRFKTFAPNKILDIFPKDLEQQPARVERIRQGYVNLKKIVDETGMGFNNFFAILNKVREGGKVGDVFSPNEERVVKEFVKLRTEYLKFDEFKEQLSKKDEARTARETQAAERKRREEIKAARSLLTQREKTLDVPRIREVAQRELPTPKITSLKLDDRAVSQALVTIKAQFRNLDNVVAGTENAFLHFSQALEFTQGIGSFADLSSEAKKMVPILESIIRQNSRLALAEQKAVDKVKELASETARVSAGTNVIQARTADVILPEVTAANRTKIDSYHKAIRDLRKEFKASGADAIVLDGILKRLAEGEKFTVVDEFDKLHESAIRFQSTLNALGIELNKTGQGLINKSLKDLRDEFRLSGATVEEFKAILKGQISGSPFVGKMTPELNQLNDKIKEVITNTKAHGDASKDEVALLQLASTTAISAIEAEIAAMEKRARKTRQDIADRKRQRKIDEELARPLREEEIRERTEKRQAIHETVRGKFPTLPTFVQAPDVAAVNAGFAAITNAALKAGLSGTKLNEVIKSFRAQLAQPLNSQIFAPLSPEMDKVRQAVIQTENAFRGIESPASKAGKGILISWQGVFRLFQAQVLHTALSQIIADFRQAITEVGNFQREVALIQTITQDADNAATTFDNWSESIVRLANELGKTPTEIATASYDALSNQITTTKNNTEAFVRTAGEFARTTGSTTPDAVNLLSSAITSYGLSATDAESVSAKFFATIDLGRVKASDLANSYGRVTSLSSALGVSIDELNAGLVVLTQQGVKAPDALTQLNAVFSKLLKPTEATKELFKELGVVSGESLIAAQGFGGALATIAKAAEEGKGDFTEFFNELRSARGGFTLAKNGAEQFQKALRDLSVAQGKFQTAKPLVVTPAGVQLQQQLNELKNFITEDFGAKMAAQIVSASNAVGGFVNVFKTGFNQIKIVINTVIDSLKILAETAAAALAISAVKNYASAIGGIRIAIVAGAGALERFLEFSAVAFETHPIIAAATAIAVFTVGVRYLVNQYQELEEESFQTYKAQVEGASKTSAEITAGYTKAIGEQTAIQQEGLRKQAGGFAQFASEARKHLQSVANEYKTFSEEVRRALEVAFGSVNDVLKDQISKTESGITDLKRSLESINKFQIDSIQQFNQDAFQRKLATASPEQKGRVLQQRIGDLGIEAIKLFDQDNIDETLNTLKEINKLDSQTLDLFPKALLAQRKLQARQDRDRAFETQPVVLNETRNRLTAALQKQAALSAQVATNEREALTLNARRIEGIQKINNLINEANNVKKSKGEIEETTKLLEMYRQLRGIGISRAGTEAQIAERMRLQGVFTDKMKESLKQRLAEEEQNLAAQKANLRNVELLQEQLNKVKIFESTGELISDNQVIQAIDKIDRLKGQLIEAIRTAGEQGAIPIELIGPKTTAVSDQVDTLKRSLTQEFDQAKKIDFTTISENKFKDAIAAANTELGVQNKIITNIASSIDEAARKAQSLGKKLAKTGSELFDPGIFAKLFDDDVIPNPEEAVKAGRGTGTAVQKEQIRVFKELMTLQEQIRKIGPFELKTPEGSKAAVITLETYMNKLRDYLKLTGREDLLQKPIKIITPTGGEGVAPLIEVLRDLLVQYRKTKQGVEEKISAQGTVDLLNALKDAKNVQSVVPEGGTIRTVEGQATEIIDALGNIVARVPEVMDAYLKAREQFIKEVNGLGIPQRLQRELTMPTELRQPQLIGPPKPLPPPESRVPITNPAAEEMLKKLSEPVKVKIDTTDIERAAEKIKIPIPINVDTKPAEKALDELEQRRLKAFDEVFPPTPPSVPDILTPIPDPGIIESSLDDTRLKAGLVFEDFKIKGLEAIQAIVDKIKGDLVPSLNIAAIEESPNAEKAVAGPTGFRTAVAATALGQKPSDELKIKPVNPIDIIAAINSIDQIKFRLNALFSQGIGFKAVIPIAEITMGLNSIQQAIGQTNRTFSSFANGAQNAVRSIASVIVSELIPAIQSAQAALSRLNATPVRSAAPAKAASTGGIQFPSTQFPSTQYFARGGMVPVMTTPGELFFDPEYTRKHRKELELMNRYKVGGVSKGSDTELRYLQPGTFVLNKRASEHFFKNTGGIVLGPKSVEYLYTGGMTPNNSFTTQYAPKGITSTVSNTNSSSSLDMSNMTINVQGGANVSTEALALKLGKSIQRQVRIGRLKGN